MARQHRTKSRKVSRSYLEENLLRRITLTATYEEATVAMPRLVLGSLTVLSRAWMEEIVGFASLSD